MKFILKLGVLLSSVMLGSQAHAGKPLDMLQAFTKNVTSLKADFVQTLEDAKGMILQRQTGKVVLKKPGQFHWHYQTPEDSEQHIVADGKELWFYDVDLEEVSVKPMDDALGTAPIALLTSNQPIADSFKITELGLINGQYMLQLEAKVNDTDYGQALLAFNSKGELQIMQLRDPMNQITTIEFKNTKLNPKVNAKQFVLNIPKGVNITRSTANPAKP